MLAGTAEQRVVFGHTHLQFRRSGPRGVELLNPGSVGMPLDGDPRAAYALVHDDGRSSSAGWSTTATRRSGRCASGSETSHGRGARSGGCTPTSRRDATLIDVGAAPTWYRSNTFRHGEFPLERLAEQRDTTVSVCLPARNEARRSDRSSSDRAAAGEGIVDQVVVVDDSTDGTGEIARDLGAEVHDQEALWPEHGPVLGKGDAMWRALRVLRGEIVCFVDADSEEFGSHFVRGLVGPLLCTPAISFVKGFYRRPLRHGETTFPDGGGRVTELTARPLLNMFYPELAAVQQPLVGEIAARRDALERLPFVTGYGVDIALLIDAYTVLGLDAIAQADLARAPERPSAAERPRADGLRGPAGGDSRLARDGRLTGPLPTTFTSPGAEGPHSVVSEPVQRPRFAASAPRRSRVRQRG